MAGQSKNPKTDAADVLAYLRAHPDFLQKHPDLLTRLVPPAQAHGEGIEDFQQHMLKNLQSRLAEMQERLDAMAASSRDHRSLQHRLHRIALLLAAAGDIESFLQVLTQDAPALLDADMVRLIVESPLAELAVLPGQPGVDSGFGGDQSGLHFAPLASLDGGGAQPHAVADAMQEYSPALEFCEDCQDLLASHLLLPLTLPGLALPGTRREAWLVIGSRHAGRYPASTDRELLQFFADFTSLRFEACLQRSGLLPYI